MTGNNRISYEKDGEQFVLECVSDAERVTLEHAVGALALLAASYAHQFEKPRGSIPNGTFTRWFDMDDGRRVNAQCERMRRYIENNESVYWLFHNADPASITLKGLSKVSPSRATWAQKAHLEAPNCYVNDLVVLPKRQDEGIGSALLHAPLTYGGFDQDKAVVLDAYRGHEQANSWFERLGLVPTGAYRSITLAGHKLDQLQYATTPFVMISDVRERLEASHPWLRTAEPLTS